MFRVILQGIVGVVAAWIGRVVDQAIPIIVLTIFTVRQVGFSHTQRVPLTAWIHQVNEAVSVVVTMIITLWFNALQLIVEAGAALIISSIGLTISVAIKVQPAIPIVIHSIAALRSLRGIRCALTARLLKEVDEAISVVVQAIRAGGALRRIQLIIIAGALAAGLLRMIDEAIPVIVQAISASGLTATLMVILSDPTEHPLSAAPGRPPLTEPPLIDASIDEELPNSNGGGTAAINNYKERFSRSKGTLKALCSLPTAQKRPSTALIAVDHSGDPAA